MQWDQGRSCAGSHSAAGAQCLRESNASGRLAHPRSSDIRRRLDPTQPVTKGAGQLLPPRAGEPVNLPPGPDTAVRTSKALGRSAVLGQPPVP